jgi:hypothetical protein
MAGKERLQERNKEVRKHVAFLFKKYPHWNYEYILEKTAEKFFCLNGLLRLL